MGKKGEDGEVLYVMRADDSYLVDDLNDAEKKIEKSVEGAADAAHDAAKSSGRKVESAVKESVDKTTQTHKQGYEEVNKEHEKSGEKRKSKEKEIGDAMAQVADSVCGEIGVSFSKIMDTVTSPAGVAAAAGAAVVGTGVKAVSTAIDIDSALNQLRASTGATSEETEKYKKVMEDVYANNFGDGFGDIANVISNIRQQVGGVVDAWKPEALQGMVESALALQDMSNGALDTESSVRAAATMMEQFGADGDGALGLIAKGYQNGLDYSGELLDSINEYSVQFAKMGFDAYDMFNIFQKGAETGAFNLDKVGDAIKEFSIRAIDGSKSTKEGFETIGLNADEMAAKFSAGGESAKEAFKETMNALAGMEDPLAQNTAGVDLFGTMWEDLGPEAVTALADVQDELYGTGEEMENVKELMSADLGSQFESLKRNIELLLVPLGEKLIPILSEIMEEVLPPLMEALEPLLEVVGQILEPLLKLVSECLEPILEIIGELLEPFLQLIQEILEPLSELIDAFLEPLMELIDSCIKPLLDLVLELIEPLLQMISECIGPLIEVFSELFEPIFKLVESALKPLLELLEPIVDFIVKNVIPILGDLMTEFEKVFESIAGFVTDKIERVQEIIESLVDFIENVFSGNWEAAWQNIVDIFTNIFDGIADFFKAPINAIVDGWNSLADEIGVFEIPEWVPFVGGGEFSLPYLPRLKVGMDYVPSDFYPAYLDEGEAVLTKQENAMYRQLGGLQGMYSMINATPSDMTIGIDSEAIGREIAAMINGSKVILDGKEVGVMMTPYIDQNSGTTISLKRRGAL